MEGGGNGVPTPGTASLCRGTQEPLGAFRPMRIRFPPRHIQAVAEGPLGQWPQNYAP